MTVAMNVFELSNMHETALNYIYESINTVKCKCINVFLIGTVLGKGLCLYLLIKLSFNYFYITYIKFYI